jgi:hypothetical protein
VRRFALPVFSGCLAAGLLAGCSGSRETVPAGEPVYLDVTAAEPPPGLSREARGAWWVAHNRWKREEAAARRRAELRAAQARLRRERVSREEQRRQQALRASQE